jgi:HlyD family secretion protein
MAVGGKSSRFSRWLLGTALFAAAVTGAVWVRTSLRASPPIDVSKLGTVERGDIARSVVATGKIQPLTQVELKSKASGVVKQVFVSYGDSVKEGQVLLELDKEDLQARVREAQANLQAAEAFTQSAQAGYERNQLDAEGTELSYLKSSAERNMKLYHDGLVSLSVAEEADKNYRVAINRQMMAQRNAAATHADVGRAKAQAAQSQAALDRAQEDLRNSTITSPMNGLVLSRGVNPGDSVSSILVVGSTATVLLTLGDVQEVFVLGKVQEADVGRIFTGQRSRIVVESLKDKPFEGKVDKISPLGVEKDNVTTFEVRVSIANPSGELRANMSANAEIIHEEKKGVLLIPEAAVSYGKEHETTVEIPDPKAPEGKRKVAVTLGISNGNKTEVLSGLKQGGKVVLP